MFRDVAIFPGFPFLSAFGSQAGSQAGADSVWTAHTNRAEVQSKPILGLVGHADTLSRQALRPSGAGCSACSPSGQLWP